MPATDSFTSSAVAVSSAVGSFTDTTDGSKVLTGHGNWAIRVSSKGVTVSKAATFGGTQVAVPWPVSLYDARALAEALLKAAT